MRVAKIDRFDLLNNPGDHGPALTIWFAGCPFNCKGCHNPELKDWSGGEEYTVSDILTVAEESWATSVVLLGGEPLAQPGIGELISQLRSCGMRIWLYTGFEFGEILPHVLDQLYFVKTGQYMELLATNSFPASSNQHIYRRIQGQLVQEV